MYIYMYIFIYIYIYMCIYIYIYTYMYIYSERSFDSESDYSSMNDMYFDYANSEGNHT
jgi:hypothetical protein